MEILQESQEIQPEENNKKRKYFSQKSSQDIDLDESKGKNSLKRTKTIR